MSNLRQAAQQALEAFTDYANQYPHMQKGYMLDAEEALRAALVEPDVPETNFEGIEPVAWIYTNTLSGDYEVLLECPSTMDSFRDRPEEWHSQPLYAHPPQRKPLSEGEILARASAFLPLMEMKNAVDFARAIEAAHGITGEKK
jgi:hypothetical protein